MNDQSERTEALLRRLMGEKASPPLDQLLAPGHVLVCLGKDVAQLPQAQLTFSFAVNLLSRLHPVIQRLQVVAPREVASAIRTPRWHRDHVDAHIRTFLEELKPPLAWSVEADVRSTAQVALIVGRADVAAKDRVHVGSDGWEVIISPDSPVASGSLVNPIGAYAAACMAVGEVWKRLLVPHHELFPRRPIIPLDQPLRLSCFTYRSDSAGDENPPIGSEIDLGRLTMVGLGAGGGASAFTLASLAAVQGNLTLVEPDEVNGPNLNRYVFASDADARIERRKTEVVEGLFQHHPGLTLASFPEPFSKVQGRLRAKDLRHVLAAVHSRQARRDLQYETPEILWDGGATEDGEFRIWRVALGRTECMFCKHPVDEGDPERDEAAQLAELLGFTAAMWLDMIRDNRAFTADEIAVLAKRRTDGDLLFDLPKESERYSDWYRNQCGRLRLPEMDQEIPIPFAPVMAGVLLAGEIVKERQFPTAALPHYYGNTLVGSWMRRVVAQRRPPKAGCTFCHDPVFRSQFERRWGVRAE